MRTDYKGSAKDPTWDKVFREHKCCHSRSQWRHKNNCPALQNGWITKPGDQPQLLRSQHELAIAGFKINGYTSRQIARLINIPLIEVNEIYMKLPMPKGEQPYEMK